MVSSNCLTNSVDCVIDLDKVVAVVVGVVGVVVVM